MGIVFILTGGLHSLTNIISYSVNNPGADVPINLIINLAPSIVVCYIVAIILLFVMCLFFIVSKCRLAKYDSLTEGLRFKEIYYDIRKIGTLDYIGFLFVIGIIECLFIGLGIFIRAIPYVGWLIVAFSILSFVFIFNSRAIALLYTNVE